MNIDDQQDALDFLHGRSARLAAYLRVLVGAEADDVLQETFLRFLDDGPRTTAEEAERWLFCVARNLGLKAIRGNLRRRQREVLSFKERSGSDPEVTLARQEEHAKIIACLDRLDGENRELVYLKVVENQSYQELSDFTGLPRSTLQWKVQQGLLELKRLFHA